MGRPARPADRPREADLWRRADDRRGAGRDQHGAYQCATRRQLGGVHGFKAYVAQSRAREAIWLVTSDGAERTGVAARRALGSSAPIGEPDVWRQVSENLSRQPGRQLASDVALSARPTTQADRDAARLRSTGRSAGAAQQASRRAQEAAAGRDRAATL